MRLIVDTSVAIGWLSQGQANALTWGALAAIVDRGWLVPFHFRLELCNALRMLERRGRITPEQVDRCLSTIDRLLPDVDQHAVDRVAADVLPLARRHGLTLYDALYLELAVRMSLPLATRDKDLRNAAPAANVELFAP